MSSPFASAQREVMLAKMLPDWSQDAVCAERTLPGEPWESAFCDEVTGSVDISTHEWPERVQTVMALACARCPVRRPCLEYAFTMEQHTEIVLLTGEVVDNSFRSGVYGGTPGAVREELAKYPDRLERAEAWFDALCRRKGWSVLEPEQTMTA